jgi:glycogen operon protein
VRIDPDHATPRDIDWYHTDGRRRRDHEWHTDHAAAIAVFLSDHELVDLDGRPLLDDAFYLCLNARTEDIDFTIPREGLGGVWLRVLDTAATRPFDHDAEGSLLPGDRLLVVSHSLVLLRWPR